uniref:Titin n=1 Tax=Sinocyclocheilus rhinocerous TaxID=307959 RepID=A0A673GNE1_9TELE
VPGPPGPIEASGISSEKVTLTWTPPHEDGGSPIKYYTLEKRETSRLLWTILAEKVIDCHFVANKLIQGNEYIFRVSAVNSSAAGDASHSEPVKMVDSYGIDILLISGPPGPPAKPEVENVGGNSVTIAWKRPADDGGSDIMGYMVERKEKEATPLRITEFVVPNLQAGTKYNFRICAMNAMGVSEPAQTKDLVEIVEREEIPDLELDIELRRTLVVRAGASIRIFIPIKGRPTPTVTWTKEDSPLKTRAIIDNTESYTLLVIPDCNRRDAGKYDLTLENAAGKKTNSVSLVWTKPKHDGGSRVTGYVIEAQRKGTDQWAHVTTVKTLDFTVKNLNENEEYIFRVMAVNSSGRSRPRVSKPVVIKEQSSEPEFDLRGVCQKTVIAKAGNDIKVEVPVSGRPKPTLSWQKDNQALKLTQRTMIENTSTSTILIINECLRSDCGIYSMTGKNIVGSVTDNPIICKDDIE